MLELSDILNAIKDNVGLLVGVGLPLMLLVAIVLTWMAGILASLERLTFLRTIYVSLIESAVCLLAVFVAVVSVIPDVVSFSFQLGLTFTAPSDWTKTGIAAGVVAGVDLVLLGLLLWLFAGASVWAVVKAWVFRILLFVLLALLLAGAAFVGVGIAQVAQNQKAHEPLMWFGIVVGGVIALIVALYFIVTSLRGRAR